MRIQLFNIQSLNRYFLPNLHQYQKNSSDGLSNTEAIFFLKKNYAHRFQADDSQESKPDLSQLPSETIEFAHRMFEAARTGDSTLLLNAVDSGLPANLTNDKGSKPSPL